MTDHGLKKGKKLSHEILGVLFICILISIVVFYLLFFGGTALLDVYIMTNDIVLTEFQLYEIDGLIFNFAFLLAVIFFVIIFLFLLRERLSYLLEIFKGIEALQNNQLDYKVPLEGNNELTHLAESVNYLSQTQHQIRTKEKRLNDEKEQLIRSLSHDIRTPLTSILSYSELLSSKQDTTIQEYQESLQLIRKKATQIKELTDILLDGGRRNIEYFDDALLLMEQLAADFEETLEDTYTLHIDLSKCTHFNGSFDVQELRRIFDNLISNIMKYADTSKEVSLCIEYIDQQVIITQKNYKKKHIEAVESYQMGLNSIRRIAHNYHGQVMIKDQEKIFEIYITLHTNL